jgi:hypothetical protein
MHLAITTGWDNFLVAQLGASAALLGLLFVAVSINLAKILQFRQLPVRAVEALLALSSVMVVCTFALVPAQSEFAYGLEIALTGLLTWIAQTAALIATRDSGYESPLRILLNQLPAFPFFVGGIEMACGFGAGIYWIVPGILLSIVSSLFTAWVLLIEIQR